MPAPGVETQFHSLQHAHIVRSRNSVVRGLVLYTSSREFDPHRDYNAGPEGKSVIPLYEMIAREGTPTPITCLARNLWVEYSRLSLPKIKEEGFDSPLFAAGAVRLF